MRTNLNPSGLYCAYLRKSRKDAELEALGQGETLARHAQALAELAGRLGIAIAQTYRELVSGDTIAERPQMRALLRAVNAGAWDGVLCMDPDRLGRGDSVDQGMIMQSFYTRTPSSSRPTRSTIPPTTATASSSRSSCSLPAGSTT